MIPHVKNRRHPNESRTRRRTRSVQRVRPQNIRVYYPENGPVVSVGLLFESRVAERRQDLYCGAIGTIGPPSSCLAPAQVECATVPFPRTSLASLGYPTPTPPSSGTSGAPKRNVLRHLAQCAARPIVLNDLERAVAMRCTSSPRLAPVQDPYLFSMLVVLPSTKKANGL